MGNKTTLTRREFIRMAALASFSPTLPRFSVPHVELEGLGLEFVQAATPPVGVPYWAASRSGDESGNLLYLVATAGGSIRAGRELLTEDRQFYVDPAGSDDNDGLSIEYPFASPQKAMDVVSESLDLGGIYTVTVNIGDGTYTTPLAIKSCVGLGNTTNLIFQGNSGSPANVLLNITGTNGIAFDGPQTTAHLKYMKVQTNGVGMGVNVVNHAVARLTSVHFGPCAYYHLLANGQGRIGITAGAFTISGGATFFMASLHGSEIQMESVGAITLTGTPAFGVAFAYAQAGNLRVNGNTFIGSATGARYRADFGYIFTNGAGINYLPGNLAGSVMNGGQYV